MHKARALAISILTVAVASTLFFTLSIPASTKAVLSVQCAPANNIVSKEQGEAFTVNVTFKNMGKTNGRWNVSVTFEGESNWGWKGTPQTLMLNASETATLTWNGNVPANADVGSTARLIVYFGNNFLAQNWWILVTPGAELTIISSNVS
ncbi:MAG TPA: hypothetical protein VK487_06160 [Candidatus Bathyarchaeia archaeon]|nr:hypothetical protein [Candidatus Bathyarchaeia archaeon]